MMAKSYRNFLVRGELNVEQWVSSNLVWSCSPVTIVHLEWTRDG